MKKAYLTAGTPATGDATTPVAALAILAFGGVVAIALRKESEAMAMEE